MKKNILLICLCFVTGIYTTQAQFSVFGIVKNTDGKAIPNASIVVKVDEKTVLSFSSTSATGNYSFVLRQRLQDSFQICASSVGYAKQCFAMTKATAEDTIQVNFILSRQETVMNEVIVSAKNKGIQIKEDTTSYNLSYFRDSIDMKLEDVLKKLPGINVEDNGDISFKGKKIEKILVEGEDFFSKDYRLLSKNIDAASVEKVDAIENYNEEALLKNLQKGQQTVLNLSFKNKTSFFGTVRAGIGTEDRKMAGGTLFALKKKLRIGNITHFNNTGEDVASDIKYQFDLKDIQPFTFLNAKRNPVSPIKNLLPLTGSKLSNRYTFNRIGINATQINFLIAPKLKVTWYAYGSSSLLNQYKTTSTVYQPTVANLIINDTNNAIVTPKTLFSQLVINYSLNKNTNIKFITAFNTTSIQNEAINNTSFNTAFFSNRFSPSSRPQSVSGRLSLVKRIDSVSAMIADAGIIYNKDNGGIITTGLRYKSIFQSGRDSTSRLFQNYNLKQPVLFAQFQYIKAINKHRINIKANYEYDNSEINTETLYSDAGGPMLQPNNDSFVNKQIFKRSSLLSQFGYEWKVSSKFSTNAAFLINYLNVNNQRPLIVSQNRRYFFPAGTLKGSIKLNKYASVDVLAVFNNEVLSVTDVYKGFVLSNSNNFINNDLNGFLIRKNTFGFRYNYADVYSKDFVFTLDAVYITIKNPLYTNTSIAQNFNYSTQLMLPGNKIYGYGYRLQADKFIYPVRHRIRWNSSFDYSTSFEQINSLLLLENRGIQSRNTLSLSSGFKGFLNYIATIDYAINSTSLKNNSISKFKNVVFKTSLVIKAAINNKLHIMANAERFNVKNVSFSRQNAFFSDLNAFWLLPKKKLTLQLTAQNIFKNRTLVTNSISPISTTNDVFRLLPRFFFLSATLRF